ncbi:MAG: 4'-phosphopantetheinyl transferase superfamily protein [Bacteroidetes bacterium]|nr:4'-phosphopantetheinyl transferase superfamily protein [Bacteroidota bacterium]
MRYSETDLSEVQLNRFTASELQKYNAFKSVKRKSEFYYVRVLWEAFGIDQVIEYDLLGRPFLKNGFISISHSHDLILIAYDPDHPVGIDVEYYSPKIREVHAKYISVPDRDLINVNSDRDLTIVWSIKEAVYKMERLEGLSFKEHIHVSIRENEAWVDVIKDKERHQYRFSYIDRQNYIITFCSRAYLNHTLPQVGC